MAKPPVLPDRVTMIQRLFSEMPETFSRDPLSVPALSFTLFNPLASSDYVSLYIADGVMIVNSMLSYIDNEIIPLYTYTLNDLRQHFNGKYGYRGIHVEYAGTSGAFNSVLLSSILLEGIYTVTSDVIEIDKFTSPNYGLLQSLALMLVNQELNKNIALQQMDLRIAQGKWLDFWGTLFSIPRISGEYGNDDGYRARLQSTIIGLGSTNVALENFVTSFTGRLCSVKDGGQPYALSGTNISATGTATLTASSDSFSFALNSGSAVSIGQTASFSSTASFLASFNGTTMTVTNGSISGYIAVGQILSSPAFTGTVTITGGSNLSWTINTAQYSNPLNPVYVTAQNVSNGLTIDGLPITGGSTSGTYSLSASASASGTEVLSTVSPFLGSPIPCTNYLTSVFSGSISVTSFSGSATTGTIVAPNGTLSIGDFVTFSVSSSDIRTYKIRGVGTIGSPNTTYYASSSNPTSYSGTINRIILTVSSVTQGSLQLDQTVSFTSNNIAYTYIIKDFLTGSSGAGTYGLIPKSPTTNSAAISVSSTVMNGDIISDPNSWTSYLNSYTLGPNTGTGSFVVLVKRNTGETALPYEVQSNVVSVINQWKPAGVPFSVQSY